MGSTEKLCLRWNDFQGNISSVFRDLKEEKDFSDVTLICADQQVEAHRVILAASSPFFKKVLRKVENSHPLIYMKGVKFSDLEAVLSFVYHGEVNVAEADLNNFLAVAEELEVKGLTCGKKYTEGNSNHLPRSNSKLQPQPSVPPFSQSATAVTLETPLKTEQEWLWSASENKNADEAVPDKRESESSQFVNTSKASVEEVDQYAGHEVFSQEKGEEFDLNNHIEKIGEGVNLGKFKCNICGHVSSQKSHVRIHVETIHFPGLVEYSCDQCEQKFDSRSKYYNHRSYHHSSKKQ